MGGKQTAFGQGDGEAAIGTIVGRIQESLLYSVEDRCLKASL